MTSLARTYQGHTRQINRAFLGMADELERNAVILEDVPMTAQQYECIIEDLRQKLADAEALINDMRAIANSDGTDTVSGNPTKYWDSKRVAKESKVAICTICRNADILGGTKLGGDWLFPVGTTYGKKRKGK